MLSSVQSYGLSGIEGFSVQIQVDITNGLPACEVVGLPDAAVRESKERVRAAIRNSGFAYPMCRITVNLAPAGMKKEGAVYDLPIAVGILAAGGQIPPEALEGLCFVGELALDGRVCPIDGVLPMVIDAYAHGSSRVLVPAENAQEAAYVTGVAVYPVNSLRELAEHLRGSAPITPLQNLHWDAAQLQYGMDFSEIKGQQSAKRAAEIAVSGGHNLLLIGTPGSGKTMLARAIPSILPDLSFQEALEITKLHSVVGGTRHCGGILHTRPFRAPHHSASVASLVGGGSKAQPGEISLAHYGVLFLDELPEFKKDVLEALRQPLEDGVVTISRAAANATYPADFMLVAAMNPCPCGNYGSRVNACRCTPNQIRKYQSRLSGPLLDRIDLNCEMTEVGYGDISAKAGGETSDIIRKRVNQTRDIQRARYEGEGIYFNAQLNNRMIRQYCMPDEAGEKLLRMAFTSLNLSARAYNRILKVARTIADMEESEGVLEQHVAEAIQYRSVDERFLGIEG